MISEFIDECRSEKEYMRSQINSPLYELITASMLLTYIHYFFLKNKNHME